MARPKPACSSSCDLFNNGVKASTGQWVMFDGKIDGYTHDENTVYLRLSRYTVDADKNMRMC